jgi:WD40 repeat protein
VEGSQKRQKLSESSMNVEGYLKCQGGVHCMVWPSEDTLMAGCADHQLKVFDMVKQQVVDNVFTNHKVITCLDATPGNLSALAGHEDGVVKLYDLRACSGVKQHRAFEANSSYISQVRICPKNSHLFAAAGYDGKVRLWDTRNESEPLFVLKRKTNDEFKVFALGWNPECTQIVSGGSDSNISMHAISM